MERWVSVLGIVENRGYVHRVIARHLFDLLIRIHLSLFFFFLSFKIVRDILEFFIIY